MPALSEATATWHILDVGSIWMKEFASALGSYVPAIGWSPAMGWCGMFEGWVREETLLDPPMRVIHFPLQRGYHRFPLSLLTRLGERQTKRMRSSCLAENEGPLICTTPYYASVAEQWKGPVVYYQTDLTFAYAGVNRHAVRRLDARMCRVATVVCPNSRRIGEYMVYEAGCDPAKIEVIPNATRKVNISSHAPSKPGPLPDDIRDLPRPIAGVIGNLAGNLNWSLLNEAVARTPTFSWVFVGPTSMTIANGAERAARKSLLRRGGRVRFVGSRSYSALQEYARAIDVAVLPYRRKEPTFSGSSTRFYEHLAACRPMIGTRGFEELLQKQPLLTLIDTADELVANMASLSQQHFFDGLLLDRWEASKRATWHDRALSLIHALQCRWEGKLEISCHLAEALAAFSIAEPFTEVMAGDFELIKTE